ncbi:MAG: dihydroneopterin aldolase [Gammaproteobacteria bacterium]|nr:dihydroneopterin aldolase [Gammaproteobacteria bacterium]
MTDTIFLKDLRIQTIVGVWDWERRLPQMVSIDLEMAADIRRAAAADSLDATLDYKALTNRIRAFVEASRFQLIETMAEQVAAIILGEFGVPWVRVTVHKPFAIRDSRDVGVSIERGAR